MTRLGPVPAHSTAMEVPSFDLTLTIALSDCETAPLTSATIRRTPRAVSSRRKIFIFRMAAHRKADRRPDDLCVGGLRIDASSVLMLFRKMARQFGVAH